MRCLQATTFLRCSVIIRYDLTLDDLLNFHVYHVNHSPSLQRALEVQRWMIPCVVVCVGLLVDLFRGSLQLTIAAVVIAMALALILHSRRVRISHADRLRRELRRLYAEGRTDTMLGPHEIEIDHDGVTERNEFGERFVTWAGVSHIAEDEVNLYIFLSAISAIIVPRRSLTRSDYTSFSEQAEAMLRAHWASGSTQAIQM